MKHNILLFFLWINAPRFPFNSLSFTFCSIPCGRHRRHRQSVICALSSNIPSSWKCDQFLLLQVSGFNIFDRLTNRLLLFQIFFGAALPVARYFCALAVANWNECFPYADKTTHKCVVMLVTWKFLSYCSLNKMYARHKTLQTQKELGRNKEKKASLRLTLRWNSLRRNRGGKRVCCFFCPRKNCKQIVIFEMFLQEAPLKAAFYLYFVFNVELSHRCVNDGSPKRAGELEIKLCWVSVGRFEENCVLSHGTHKPTFHSRSWMQ